jgi:predicted metal-dependent hydrolase
MMTTLTDEFTAIVRNFFPDWKNGEQWQVREGYVEGRPRTDGVCVWSERTIHVAPEVVEEGAERLQLVLIHEVCHAVCSGEEDDPNGHSQRFQQRAHHLGKPKLALALHTQSLLLAQAATMSEEAVYAEVEDWARQNAPFEDVLDKIARRVSKPVEQLVRDYPRIRDVYDRAALEALRIR